MSCSEWQKVRLGDVIEFNPKETIKKKQISKKVSMDKLDTFTRKINGYEEVEFTSGTKFRNGDTLLARITPCLENGKTAQVDILDDGEVAFGSTEFIVLREKKGKTINDYIYYLSISPLFRNIAIKCMTGTSGRQRVQKDVLEDTEILLPPLEEQEKIADILSSLDDRIELNNEMNKTLEEMAQSIFKRWFVDFEFPNEDGQPYKSSGGETIESELGIIPKGWKIIQIDDISQVTMGVSPSSKTYNEDNIGLPLLNGAADFEGKLIKPNKFTSEPKKICKKGDMVFGVRATIGNIVFADKEYALGRGVAAVEPNDTVFREFIYYSLDNSMENLINNASGSVFLNLKKVDISDLKVCYSEEIVKKFNNIAKVLIDNIVQNHIENRLLKQQRDILLYKLLIV